MSEQRTRVEIGFDSEDMAGYHVDVSKVSYVKHEQHVGRVGF